MVRSCLALITTNCLPLWLVYNGNLYVKHQQRGMYGLLIFGGNNWFLIFKFAGFLFPLFLIISYLYLHVFDSFVIVDKEWTVFILPILSSRV